ncbi:hypothetical protein [Nocardia sp. alder85J]|uniref:hypothetical protein n=1 Tax=Nocardia sp. alder85J TaxID=2862949 RepID=UPI001CD6D68E|nr:hypothetical protein [Nocardia sp. alder85J]MCX4099133.1 hypothetical protein [Nocardia sp. alder85J]
MIAGVPVLIVLPRFRSVHIAPDGGLVSADGWTSKVCEHGARPMVDLEFVGGPEPGWRVALDAGAAGVRVTGPAGLGEMFAGELVCEPDWWRQVELDHRAGLGLVVVTGTARTDPDAALEMMEAGRAVWVRARTTFG